MFYMKQHGTSIVKELRTHQGLKMTLKIPLQLPHIWPFLFLNKASLGIVGRVILQNVRQIPISDIPMPNGEKFADFISFSDFPFI